MLWTATTFLFNHNAMIARSGCFGKSPNQLTVNPQSVLTTEGIEKASRNRKIFNRAIYLIMRDLGYDREQVLAWLDNDEDETWVEYNEANPGKQI